MTLTDYEIFFATHKRPGGWNVQADHLLYHFFSNYNSPGDMGREILDKLSALIAGKSHPELPDDWTYCWGKVLPRQDYVYFFDQEDKHRIPITQLLSWEGSALRDETTVENACTVFMKIPTADFLRTCTEWDQFNLRKN